MKKTWVLYKGQLEIVFAYDNNRIYLEGIDKSLSYKEIQYVKDPTNAMEENLRKKGWTLTFVWGSFMFERPVNNL